MKLPDSQVEREAGDSPHLLQNMVFNDHEKLLRSVQKEAEGFHLKHHTL